MSKKEAIKMLLVDVCCSNGKEFCEVCPLKEKEECENFHCDENQLLEAVIEIIKEEGQI